MVAKQPIKKFTLLAMLALVWWTLFGCQSVNYLFGCHVARNFYVYTTRIIRNSESYNWKFDTNKIKKSACEKFLKWAQEQSAYSYSENVMLAYFSHLAKTLKSSSLWARYSMIKAELNIKHNVQLAKYTKLLAFLKRQGEGYKPKKSKVFTKEQFDEFLHNAPNSIYLATKVNNTLH